MMASEADDYTQLTSGFMQGEVGAQQPVQPPQEPQKPEPKQDKPDAVELDEDGEDSAESLDADGDADDYSDDASDDDGDDDASSEGSEDQEDVDQPRKKRRSGTERFRRQRERAEAAEAYAAALEARLAAIEKQFGGQQPAPELPELTNGPVNVTNAANQAPDPAKYQYGDLDPNYISDLADWKAEQKVAKLREEILAERRQETAIREAEQIRNKALETAQVGSERYADFMEVVVEGAENDEWALTETMLQSALESDKGADILYYLATHPDEAEKVARMDTRSQDRWFGRMEARIKRPEARKVSKAPAPVKTARGAGGKFASDPATSDFAAFERMASQRK
jgi:hypothetical protein